MFTAAGGHYEQLSTINDKILHYTSGVPDLTL